MAGLLEIKIGEALGLVKFKTTGISGTIASMAASRRGEDWQRQSLKH